MTHKVSQPATHDQKIEIEGRSEESLALENLSAEGGFGMRIARDGTWYHQGLPIRRMPLVKLFATVLRRDEKGVYWLQTPVEKGRIEVEDAPFTAIELEVEGAGEAQILRFRTNLDDWVDCDAGHPLRVVTSKDGEPRPYLLVRDRLEALILRPVFYQLVELAVEGDGGSLGVWSHGHFFGLGDL
jgi:hypothetical protein